MIACARQAAGATDADAVGAAAADVSNWDLAIEMARAEGLLLLLARALTQAVASAPVRQRVDDAAAPLAAQSLDRVRTLTRLTEALTRAGVRVLPYKGPMLSLQLYGDVALRDSADLDLVVPRDAYLRARAVLEREGFTSRGGHSVRQERAIFGWLGHASFGGGDRSMVELHWRFAPYQFPFALSPDDAMDRSRLVTVGGHRLRLMAQRDLAVTLAMHGARHLYERLEWLAGVARLVRDQGAEVAALLDHAERLRARRLLLVSVGVMREVLGIPLDDAWNRALAEDGDAEAAAREMRAVVLSHNRDGGQHPGGAALQQLYARMIDGRLDWLRLVARAALLPTEREWEALPLPDALTPLYRVVRPLRLVGAYLRRLLPSPPERAGGSDTAP